MNKITKLVVALIVVAVVVVGAMMLMNKKDDDKSSESSSTSTSTSQSASDGSDAGNTSDAEAVAVTITYDGSSFSSSADTMKAGEKVRVVNDSDQPLDFDSDPHPVHTDNKELNQGDIAPGESKTFMIDKKGTWGYHNHLNSSQHGDITVE